MDQKGQPGLLRWIQEEFQPKRFFPNLFTGSITGVTEIIMAVSFASLVFSGGFAQYMSYGIGIAMITASVVMIVTSLISSVPGVIGSSQDSTAVILALIAASLAGTLTSGTEVKLATLLLAITCATILTGLFFVVLGQFKWGGLVRFIPYPVVGGFLAGTGWLLIRGSFGVMTNYELTVQNIPVLARIDQLILWLPGVVFAFILYIGMRRIRHFMTMPGILIGVIILFYLGLLVSGTSIQDAIQRGFLLGEASGGATLKPFFLQNLSAVDWGAILGQSGEIAIILILGVVSLLLNVTALELAIGQDVDVNRELKAAGIANIASGFCGGMVGFHALGLSALSYRMGGRGRLPGVIAGIICALALLLGSSLLSYFPRALLGGLIFFLGLDFLIQWVFTGWSKLSKADYAVVLLILLVIAFTNFLVGVGVGIIAMVILFVVNYSRINIIHHSLSGLELRSNVERCAYYQRVLTERLGKLIYILELQGFIFFGTANEILEKIRERITDASQGRLRYIILDFRRVNGLDSSAVLSFVKGTQVANAHHVTLVLTHISEDTLHQFKQGGLFQNGIEVQVFPDLDHGLEWCEEQLLEIEQVTTMYTPVTLSAQLADRGFMKTDTQRLVKFLERVEFKKGEYLFHQGEDADKLYFIEMGIVSVYLELGNHEQVRLQTLSLGTAIGEQGLYSGAICNQSAIADTPVIAYRLTRNALTQMKEIEPELAATFHEFAARLLSERLTTTTRSLEAMLR